MMISRYAKWDAIVIFILGIVFFTLGLSQQEVTGFDARFYLFALEMWHHGFSWFPTTYQQPYPDYPVTSTLFIYLAAKLFGGLDKFTAVFPSAAAAAGTLAVTYSIGALHARRWGWCAAGFLLFTVAFLMSARTISLDMYVTLMTVVSFYIVYRAQWLQKKLPWEWLTFFLVLSFAIRGPIGLIVPTAVVCVFYLLEGALKSLLLVGMLALGLLLLCCGILFGIAYHAGGTELMHAVLRMEVLGRMQEMRTPPFYFYFQESVGAYAVSYPLAILVLLGVSNKLLQRGLPRDMKLLQILAAWALIIMLGLSIPADKKVRYILPAAPAMALICGYLYMAVSHMRYLTWLRQIFNFICFVFPLLGLALLALLHAKQVPLAYWPLTGMFIVMQAVIFTVRGLSQRHEMIIFFIAAITFVLTYIFVVEEINLNTNRTRDFVQRIEMIRAKNHAQLVFYREGKDGLVIKYLADVPQELQPVFVSDKKALNQLKKPLIIITREENAAEFPQITFRLIEKNKIGHDQVVVLELR